jgi:hypothetical protein
MLLPLKTAEFFQKSGVILNLFITVFAFLHLTTLLPVGSLIAVKSKKILRHSLRPCCLSG